MMEELDLRSRYLEIDDRMEDLQDYLAQYPGLAHEFLERYQISWLYHENALEGIVLTYHELKAAIDRKIISDVNLIPTYQEIKNHNDAIELIKAQAKNKRARITLEFVKELHGTLVKELDGMEAGRYRKEIPLHRTYFHEIAQPNRISYRLNKLLQLMASAEFKHWHPIKQVANMHHEFMAIFPFPGNSGKVGRLLMNLFLLRAGYLPVVIHSIDRQRYYECLRGPSIQLRELIIDAMENSIESAMRCIGELREEEQTGSRQDARLSA